MMQKMMKQYVQVSAPGKIIIHGEHAVVYGREAIAGCIDKRVRCTVRKVENSDEVSLRTLSAVELGTQTFNKSSLVQYRDGSPTDARSPSPLISHDLDAIASSLTKKDSGKIEQLLCRIWTGLYLSIASDVVTDSVDGISIEIDSEIPFGAGVGSSASLSVCIAAGLLSFCDIIKPIVEDPGKDMETRYRFGDGDLKLISGWAYEAEKVVHGTPSGIDNSIVTYGGALSYQKGRMEFLESFPPIDILLVNTGVFRSTADIVAGVRQRYEKLQAVYEALFDAIQLLTLEAKSNILLLNTALKEDTTKCDSIYVRLIMLTEINQNLLRAIGVGHESIDNVLRILLQFGFKGKLTGAGGGGCVFSFIKNGVNQSTLNNASQQLQLAGYRSWITRLGCDGVRCHSFLE